MANEAKFIKINEYANPEQFTCAAGTDIIKGTALQLSGDHTVSASDGANVYAGIAAMDKNSTNDTSTTISVYVPGQGNRFDMTCGAVGVTRGSYVVLEGANTIKDAVAADLLTGKVIGKALETGSAAEVVAIYS